MNKTNILIARHGETAFNREKKLQGRGIDAPLNQLGVKQANALANYVRQYPLNAIYSSTLKRAKQTAEIVAAEHNLPVQTHPELEEMSYGNYEGVAYDHIATEIQLIKKRWKEGETDVKINGGESPEQVFQRADVKIKELLNFHSSETVLFILHGRLIRILLANWLKGGLSHMHTVKHTNCGINLITWNNPAFESIYLNKIKHLSGLTD